MKERRKSHFKQYKDAHRGKRRLGPEARSAFERRFVVVLAGLAVIAGAAALYFLR